jgi:hypothetical protein
LIFFQTKYTGMLHVGKDEEWTALMARVSNSDLAVVMTIVTPENASMKRYGYSMMMMAAAANRADDPRIVRHVLNCGGNVNGSAGAYGESPLLSAIRHLNIRCVQILLQHGADVNYKWCNAPLLQWVISWGNREDIARMLIDRGASGVDIFEYYPWTGRYVELSKKCKQGAVVLLGLRKHRQTVLGSQPTDVIRLIARELWRLRNVPIPE